jgi:hypothetical protein
MDTVLVHQMAVVVRKTGDPVVVRVAVAVPVAAVAVQAAVAAEEAAVVAILSLLLIHLLDLHWQSRLRI